MADFSAPAPIAQNVNVNPAQGIQTLSSLLGLKRTQLAIAQQQIGLQQQQEELSSQTSAATIAGINAKQTQALSKINPRQYIGKDGSLDVQGLSQAAYSVAPNLASDYVARVGSASASMTAASKAMNSLNQKYQEPLRAAAAVGAADPNAKVSDIIANMELAKQDAPQNAQDTMDTVIQNLGTNLTGPDLATGQPKNPQQQKAILLGFARQGLSASEAAGVGGLATLGAGTASTGTQIIPTTTNRITGVTQAANAPPVANLHNEVSLPNGQVAILNVATGQYEVAAGGNGGIPPGAPKGFVPPAVTAANDPARPSGNAPAQVQAQWQKALLETNALVHSTRQEDQGYGNNMAVAQDIRSLSQTAGGAKVGPGTPEWTRLVGSITSRFGGSQGVTDVQTLESFLDRQAASMTSAMGLPATNIGNEQARVISGNIGMQVGALRAKNDYNEALAQGLHDYRSGLDRVAGFGGNASPTTVNRYRNQWASVFNPMAIEYKLAQSRGDRKLMTAVAQSVTPGQARRMRADLEAMDSLAAKGELP